MARTKRRRNARRRGETAAAHRRRARLPELFGSHTGERMASGPHQADLAGWGEPGDEPAGALHPVPCPEDPPGGRHEGEDQSAGQEALWACQAIQGARLGEEQQVEAEVGRINGVAALEAGTQPRGTGLMTQAEFEQQLAKTAAQVEITRNGVVAALKKLTEVIIEVQASQDEMDALLQAWAATAPTSSIETPSPGSRTRSTARSGRARSSRSSRKAPRRRLSPYWPRPCRRRLRRLSLPTTSAP